MARLALFFSRGMSLDKWLKSGLFYREVLIYQEYLRLNHYENIYWFTYGRSKDEAQAISTIHNLAFFSQIKVMPKPKYLDWLPDLIYSIVLPFIHYSKIKECCVLKSNQMNGAWTAWLAGLLTQRPFYLRTGYTWSLFEKRKWMKIIVTKIEGFLYRRCHAYSVSSQEDLKFVDRYKPTGKGVLLRNYIDLNIFKMHNPPSAISFVTVSRLTEQKNLKNLIIAFRNLKFNLDIIGEGEQKQELLNLIKENKINNVRILSRVNNHELPEILSKYSHFILFSYYEGNPKSLLEAMALGMICVGTPVPGIREILIDGHNGFISKGLGVEEAREVLERSVEGNLKIRSMGREYVEQFHSLSAYAQQERDLIGCLRTA